MKPDRTIFVPFLNTAHKTAVFAKYRHFWLSL